MNGTIWTRLGIIWALMLGVAAGSVREIVQVSQPLSFHGTDTAMQLGDEPVQAGVMSSPMVLTGAMPEVLIEAVARPLKFASETYPFSENNLFALCGIGLAVDSIDSVHVIRIDARQLKVPEEVDLTPTQIVTLAVKALEKTLADYHKGGPETATYEVTVQAAEGQKKALEKLERRLELGN